MLQESYFAVSEECKSGIARRVLSVFDKTYTLRTTKSALETLSLSLQHFTAPFTLDT
jgi:hypothetical protein